MSSTRAFASEPLLDVRDLRVTFVTRRGPLVALDGVSFTIGRGEILGMVGESGAGKSLTGAAITGLLPPGARITGGTVRFEGKEIQDLAPEAMRQLRGRRIATIFQDPLTSLNPLFTIGDQLEETIRTHLPVGKDEAHRRAVRLLGEVGLPDPEARCRSYPHEFSGGMRQRVVIALALSTEPALIIADEPTTALDVSVQAQIIQLLKRLARDHRTSVLVITHDMGVISEIADNVAVLYLGRVVETGATNEVLQAPSHPYTIGLMGSIPRIGDRPVRLPQIEGAMPRLSATPWQSCAFRPRCLDALDRCAAAPPPMAHAGRTQVACILPTLERHPTRTRVVSQDHPVTAATGSTEPPPPQLIVRDVVCHFDIAPALLDRWFTQGPRPVVRAVDGVSFHIRRAQTFALVGESGCGKSTIARLLTGLIAPTAGRVMFDGVTLTETPVTSAQRDALRRVQMVFQDPYSSLDPRWQVGSIVGEPILARGERTAVSTIRNRVVQLLEQVGLAADDAKRYPHQFSGGQRQRISIARALAGDPSLLICDEPTSALDVSVQAQILNLMKELQRRYRLTMLFISHDLAVVDFIADVVGVMYLGKLCEIAATGTLFNRPLHPYTRMLRDSVPDLERTGRERNPVPGEVPSPLAPPPGCRFHPRCPFAQARCRREAPEMHEHDGSWVACHAVEEGRIAIPPLSSAGASLTPIPTAGEFAAAIADDLDATSGKRWRLW